MALIRFEKNHICQVTIMTNHNSVMLNVIAHMNRSQIGEPRKWDKITKKLSSDMPLSVSDIEYYTRLTRIYNQTSTISKRKNYHTMLSDLDEKPRCTVCGEPSQFYCHINDQYFCQIHIVGHDPNE